MTTDDAKTGGRGDAWAVSIEVDGRQKYLFETDKLQEMVGASVIMRNMAEHADEIGKKLNVHMFQPVSGEVRAWSTERDELLHFAWRLREWLTDRGVEHTAVVLRCRADHFTCDKKDEQAAEAAAKARDKRDADPLENEPDWPHLAWVHRALTALAREVKDAKPGADARPTCSLFEACRIHGFDYANEWNPGEERPERDEPRRALRGYRARAKFDERQKDRTGRIDEEVRQALYERAAFLLKEREDDSSADLERQELETLKGWVEKHLAPSAERASTIGDLIRDPAEWLDDEGASDQFVAFVCADGDGMGRLFTGLDWNLKGWRRSTDDSPGFGALHPWERNRRFSKALDGAVREAFRAAVAKATLPNHETLKRLGEANKENRFRIPVLPQLLGGDDLWTIARRDVALRLCRVFAKAVPDRIENCPILRRGIELSEQAANKSATTGDEPKQDADKSQQVTGEARQTAGKAEQATCEAEQNKGETEPGKPFTLSMSQGVAFAKAGHPVHAMVEAAESLLNSAKALRKGQAWMRKAATEGCIDWHWIESSLSETVTEARERGTVYRAPDTDDVMLLTTRPWTLSEAKAFESAAEKLRDGVPRRKREQLEDILRRGHVLSLVAWEAWWKRLRKPEQDAVKHASKELPESWQLPNPREDPERAGCEAAQWGEHLPLTPWIDVEVNAARQQDNGERKPATDAQAGQAAKRRLRYYVTPLLDLLALDHLTASDEGRQNRDDDGTASDGGGASMEPAGEQATGEAHA